VWPLLEKAVRLAPEAHRYTPERLLDLIRRADAQLWVVWDDEREEYAAACMTQITYDKHINPTRRSLALDIPLIGGRDMKEWLVPLWTTLKLWGLSHGCSFALGYGRKGWERALGFEFYGHTSDGTRIMTRPISLEH
jgi:hypothetical protein